MKKYSFLKKTFNKHKLKVKFLPLGYNCLRTPMISREVNQNFPAFEGFLIHPN